ncbi:hypothetical protein ACLOJK_029530 [Asimina triloba]
MAIRSLKTGRNMAFRASEEYVKRAGWDPELVSEAYEWVESKVVSKPSLSAWQSAAANGMLEAGIRPFNGFSLEHIRGTKVAGTIYDAHGRRNTAADLLAAGNPRIEDVLGRSFDYIIVGGGTSGCPLAATLSQRYSEPVWPHVLDKEAVSKPPSQTKPQLIEDREKYGFVNLQTDEFTSVSQQFISEDGVFNVRGRILGGTTAINGALYSRASEEYVKRAGWDPELVVSKPSLSAWQSAAANGMLEAGIRPFNGFSLEHIRGTKVAGTIYDAHGRRNTAADLLAAGNPHKITLPLNATLQNIIFHDAGEGKQLRAHGIRFIRSNGNPDKFYELYLNHPNDSGLWGDVILSAGALGSPQILMLSGIGPKEHLTHFNITHLFDAGGVGHSMKDNTAIGISLNYSSQALHQIHLDPPHVAGIVDGFRIIIETVAFYPGYNTSIVVPMLGKLASPASRGSLRLLSADPRQNPSVRFNYLAEEGDLDECAKLVRLIDKVARSRSVTSFLGRRQSVLPNGASSYQELRDFCREKVTTVSHYHGGCVVGSVVNRDYKVFGLQGLRVVDGSTFLDAPGTNPMATVLMLGRYQGIKMLRGRERIQVSE